MNKQTFLNTLQGYLSALQGNMEVYSGSYIFINATGDTIPMLRWLDSVAFSRRYTVISAVMRSDNNLNFYWDCKGGMFYDIPLEDKNTLAVNVCGIHKTLPQNNVNISVDL